MIYLNVIYFIIITWYGYKFLRSDGEIVRSPFNKEDSLALSGPEMFWVLTFSTGLLAFSAPLPIDLMAIRLLTIMILCGIGFAIVKKMPIWTLPLKLYVVFLVWILIGCFYSPSFSFGIRVVLKYCYPLIFCLFATAACDDFNTAYKASLTARWVAVISLFFFFIPFLGMLVPGVFWYWTATAINYISIMILSLALFFFTDEKRKNLIYTIIFLLPCFLWVLRTSIMGSGVAIMAFAIIKWRLKSLPVVAAVLIAGVIAVFTIPSLKNKMFKADTENVTIENFQEGGITRENVNTNARDAMWEFLENKFYEPNKLTGSGTGSVQEYMYTHYIFGGLKVAHSDFVQMKCDNGIIGLVLYCAISILIFLHCFQIYWSTDDARLKLLAITAGATMLGVFATLYSDNSVNYSMATLSMPYGFYGMTLSLKNKLL